MNGSGHWSSGCVSRSPIRYFFTPHGVLTWKNGGYALPSMPSVDALMLARGMTNTRPLVTAMFSITT